MTAGYDTSVKIQEGQTICTITAPQTEIIQDLIIFVKVVTIDGTGSVLAQSGPCGVDQQNRIRAGIMLFDIADLQRLIETERANLTVLHEMAHVLGFGTLWERERLVGEVSDPDHAIENYPLRYLGTQGNIGNQQVGLEYEAIVETEGGQGTAGSAFSGKVKTLD